MKKLFFKIRNNWKKVCFFSVVSLGGAQYLHQLYKENQLVKAYCLNAQKYGDLKINPYENPRKIYVLLDETNDKYKYSTGKYFNNYIAPILHSGGVLVDIIKISNNDLSIYLKDSIIEKELPYITNQISAINIPNLNKSLGVIILGGEDLVSGFINYLKTIKDSKQEWSNISKFIKNFQFAWIDFGVPDSKFFKTKWSSYKPISSTFISNSDFSNSNLAINKLHHKANDTIISNLIDTAFGIACSGHQKQNDLMSNISTKLINLLEVQCNEFDNNHDDKIHDILCDNKPIEKDNATFLFQQVDVGNNEIYSHNHLWRKNRKDMFALSFDKDILYKIQQTYYELKYKISSALTTYKPPEAFNAEITFWYNPCPKENPCSACHTNNITLLQTFYKILGISKFLEYFYPKKSIPISPHHKHPEKFYLNTTHITAKFKPDSDKSEVQIIGYPSHVNSLQTLENVITKTSSIHDNVPEGALQMVDKDLLHMYKEDVKHIEINIIKHKKEDIVENNMDSMGESLKPEHENLGTTSKKIEIEILPNTFNVLHRNI